MKRIVTLTTLVAILALAVAPALAQNALFPHRADYPAVNPVGVHDLYAGLDNGEFLVVDVRSNLEFDVIHVDKAEHLPLSDPTFADNVLALAAENPGKKIAFYCNGTTCQKSYKAAAKASEAGFTEAYAYDGGIPEWAKIWPQNTLLLGKPISDPDKQLISREDFRTRTLKWNDFRLRSKVDGVVVIDVRDELQKTGELAKLISSESISLDVFIPDFVAQGLHKDKPLFIFDQVGKQVKWLQYYLEEYGYEHYFFLKGGAKGALAQQS